MLITTDLSLNAFPFVKESYEAPLKIGESREIRLACCAVSFNIEPLLPRYVLIDITNLSRIGSIGGFVTCAKSWWKYLVSLGLLELMTAKEVSLPIDPVGISPFNIGSKINLSSSGV